MSDKLREIREKIDGVDDEMARLFDERMSLVKEVAEIKSLSSLPLVHSDRENDIVKRIKQSVAPEIADFAERLFRTLFEVSKDYQAKVIKKEK